MIKTLLICFATIALAVASAASTHRITLYNDASVNGQQLKAGEYKIQVKEGTAVITSGKSTFETPVKVENSGTKFPSTSVRFGNENGSTTVQEIRLGGTTTKLVFSETKVSELR